jgi:UrcA family protein
MRTTPAILAAVLAATAFTTPAIAASDRINIRYADLDLSTEAGQAQLERRIDKAVRDACGADETNVGTRLPSRQARACYDETKAQVREQVAQNIARDANRG